MSNDIKFDPMTGEPIAPQTPAAEETSAQAAPAAGETAAQAPAPKKGKPGKIIAGVIAAAAVVTGGVFGAKTLTGGGSPVDQFREAVDKTFVADEMAEPLKTAGEYLEDGTYAVDAAINVQGQEITVRFDTDGGQLSLDAGANIQGMDIDAALYMDDHSITVDAGKFFDIDPLSYDYTVDKSGKSDSYVVKTVGEETLKQIDSMLQTAQSMTGRQDKDKVQDAVYDKLGELDYEELSEREFTIGGDKVSCKGYETTMTGEFLYELLDGIYKEAYGKGIDEMMDEIGGMGVDVGETEDLESQLKEMNEIDMKFYLNDGKFAMLGFATKADDKDVDVEIAFEGADIPWHDMTIKNVADDQEVKLNTEDSNDTLVYTLTADGSEQGKLEYSKSDGSFKVIANGETAAAGTIKEDGDAVKVAISEVSGQNVDASIDITDDADVKKAPEETKDVLELSESDFSAIAGKIVSKVYGL